MKSINTMKTTALAGLAALAMAGCGKTQAPLPPMTRDYEVDQIMQQYDGLLVYFTTDHNVVHTRHIASYKGKNEGDIPFTDKKSKALDISQRPLTLDDNLYHGYGLVRDLDAGSKPHLIYARLADGTVFYEIHLAKDGLLSPGTDAWRSGKHTVYGPMNEVK